MGLVATTINTIDAISSTKRQVNSQEFMLKNKVVHQKHQNSANLATSATRESTVVSCTCHRISSPSREGGGTKNINIGVVGGRRIGLSQKWPLRTPTQSTTKNNTKSKNPKKKNIKKDKKKQI